MNISDSPRARNDQQPAVNTAPILVCDIRRTPAAAAAGSVVERLTADMTRWRLETLSRRQAMMTAVDGGPSLTTTMMTTTTCSMSGRMILSMSQTRRRSLIGDVTGSPADADYDRSDDEASRSSDEDEDAELRATRWTMDGDQNEFDEDVKKASDDDSAEFGAVGS